MWNRSAVFYSSLPDLSQLIPVGAPTLRYQRLLPRYVLGGLAGLRNCEIIRAYPGDPVIEWPDVLWNKIFLLNLQPPPPT
jgi:hypothetical protein